MWRLDLGVTDTKWIQSEFFIRLFPSSLADFQDFLLLITGSLSVRDAADIQTKLGLSEKKLPTFKP